MKLKNFWGLLAVLFVAVFAFSACSNDDDDEKTGTYEYQVISSFEGGFESINKVNDTFKQAFGAESAPFKLTGTLSECNRKAKEYAMKAQAALAGDGSFAADVKLVNTTTDELIYSFDIQKDKNISQGHKTHTLHYELNKNGIRIYSGKGIHVKIERLLNDEPMWTAFDDVIKTDDQTIDLNRVAASYKRDSNGYYLFTIQDGTSGEELSSFLFYYDRRYEVKGEVE